MTRIPKLIEAEKKRQQDTLMMIPSENYTYPEVLSAVGSILMHKYAEGLPGKRYYQGNQVVDEVETYCQKLALKVFGVKPEDWGVNVQPHSGSEANLAAISALVEPGEKILSLSLPSGGHLSHGWQTSEKKITLTSKIWDVSFYDVDPATSLIDYAALETQAKKLKPKLIISGGTAYPQEIDHQQMVKIAHACGALYLADVSHEAGLIAGGANQSPFPHADVVTMTTHKTLRGPRGAMIFARAQLMPQINAAVFPGMQGGPHLHTIAGIAVALEMTKKPKFAQYAKQTVQNAQVLGRELIKRNFKVVSGGTAKHLLLLDLRPNKTNGWLAATALEETGIVVNRNAVPGDSASPFYPSGIRLGTPAVTVRGMKESDMVQLANIIAKVIWAVEDRSIPQDPIKRQRYLKWFKNNLKRMRPIILAKIEVDRLCRRFPLKF